MIGKLLLNGMAGRLQIVPPADLMRSAGGKPGRNSIWQETSRRSLRSGPENNTIPCLKLYCLLCSACTAAVA